MAFEIKGILKFFADTSQADEKIRQFEENLKGTFKRQAGEIRPSAAIEQFVINLTSGNVVGAFESISSRLTALGILGGVTFALMAKGLEAVERQSKAFGAALQNANDVLGNLPVAGASLELLRKSFEGIVDAQKKMVSASTATGFVIKGFQRGPEEHQDRHLVEAFVQNLKAQAESQVQAADAALIEATGLRTLSDVKKEQIALTENLAAIEYRATAMREEVEDRLLNKKIKQNQANKELKAIENDRASDVEQAKRVGELKPGLRVAGAIYAMTGLTVEELAAAGEEAPNENFGIRHRQAFPAMVQGDAYMLGVANRSLAEGERLRKLGFRDDPGGYLKRGLDIKADLGSLKDKEKQPEIMFKNALDASEKLKNIDKNTADMGERLKELNFGNQ